MLATYVIQALSSDGRGIARGNPGEKVTFVSQALPGETVLARFLSERRTFCEAEAVEILSASPHAVSAPCPHQALCGGCPLMRLDYTEQLVWKERFVRDALTRIGGLSTPPLEPILASPETVEYRNRVELAFGTDEEGRVRLGMRRRQSHAIVPTPSCRLIPGSAKGLIASIEELVSEQELSAYVPPEETGHRGRGRRQTRGGRGYLRFCQLRFATIPDAASIACADHLPGQQGIWVIFLTSPGTRREKASMRRIATDLLLRHPGVHCIVHEERAVQDMLVRGEKRLLALGHCEEGASGTLDPALMLMPLAGRTYLTDAADFFQVNGGAADLLVQAAKGCCTDKKPDALMDLYCGVGAPGLSLGASSLLGVEYSPTAVATARRNARRFGCKADYDAGDAAQVLSQQKWRSAPCTHLLCDPPRSGMDNTVRDFIRRRLPQSIVYVSCNPATLARDVRDLAPLYSLQKTIPIDLFPHTAHVESVSLLVRN